MPTDLSAPKPLTVVLRTQAAVTPAPAGAMPDAPRALRYDLIAIEIRDACEELGEGAEPSTVMGKLRSYAGRKESCITEGGSGYVKWRDRNGSMRTLTRDHLRKRLARRRNRAP